MRIACNQIVHFLCCLVSGSSKRILPEICLNLFLKFTATNYGCLNRAFSVSTSTISAGGNQDTNECLQLLYSIWIHWLGFGFPHKWLSLVMGLKSLNASSAEVTCELKCYGYLLLSILLKSINVALLKTSFFIFFNFHFYLLSVKFVTISKFFDIYV